MFTCEFCKRNFSTKQNLNIHTKTAKYCLEIQGKNPSYDYICPICTDCFTARHQLDSHKKKCKTNTEIVETRIRDACLREKIRCLEQENERLAKLAGNTITNVTTNNTTTNNTMNLNNLQMLTPEWVKSQTIHLTRQHVSDGVNGLASYAVNHPLKNRAVSTDKARRAIKFKDESGKIVKDSKGVIISKMICDSLAEPVDNHFQDIKEDIYDRVENKELPFEAIDEVRKACMLSANLKIVSSGQDHDIQRELAVKINDLLPADVANVKLP